MAQEFNSDCTECPRLVHFLHEVKGEHPDYHCRPVAPFGDPHPDLLIVGLAPGKHGANATGRPFTGDHAGLLLYATLYRFAYANRPVSTALNDGLTLTGCRITNAVKCLPPQNKPTNDEIKQCNQYLSTELMALPPGKVILVLGRLAHNAVLRSLQLKQSHFPFAHAATFELPTGHWLVDSYHCSRYNTQTRRLTEAMFHEVFRNIATLTGR